MKLSVFEKEIILTRNEVSIMRKLAEFDYMLDSFDRDSRNLNRLRHDFVNKYTQSYIKNDMNLDDFVVGKGNKNSFCYQLEFNLAQLGSIRGSNSKNWYLL